MKKQTAVEWFQDQIIKIVNGTCELSETQIFEQAKAMEREQMLKLISFVRMHNKMGKSADDLLAEFETYKGREQ